MISISSLIIGVCLSGFPMESTMEITQAFPAVRDTEISSTIIVSAKLVEIPPTISGTPIAAISPDPTPNVSISPSIGDEFTVNRTWRTLLF